VREALIQAEGQTAEDLCHENALSFDQGSPAFLSLCRGLLDADMDTAHRLARMVDPEDATPIDVPEAPIAPQPATVPLGASQRASEGAGKAGAAIPLLGLYEGYVQAQGVSLGVRREWRNNLLRLVDFLGHDDAARITREDITRWRADLLAAPAKGGKLRKPVTVRDNYLVPIRCTLAWAVEEGLLSANVASDVSVRIPKAVKTRDKDYTQTEALAILRASLSEPEGRLTAPSARAQRWIPWLCAYTGARVGELAQLRREDIRQEEGVWVLNITPEAGTVKTREARLVPLHSHLIEQGFLAMVRSLPQGPMFYNPARQRAAGDGENRHVKKVGERLAGWVRNTVGITDPAIKPNHAWRHLFKTIAGEAGIDERTADAIQGHAPTSVSRQYGRVSVKTKADAMERFPRFDLEP
jgi:integrase